MGHQQVNMFVRSFDSEICYENWIFLSSKTLRVHNKHSKLHTEGKLKFFNVFHNEQNETKQHGKKQELWPPHGSSIY